MKKFRKINFEIEIQKRFLYTIIAVLLIVGIGVGVYAIAPTPGHSSEQIEGLISNYCHWDSNIGSGGGWASCPTINGNDPRIESNIIGMRSADNKLCYKYPTGCHIETANCQPITVSLKDTSYTGSCTLSSILDQECNQSCKTQIVCNGDVSGLYNCGTSTSVKYTGGSFASCSTAGLYCNCVLSSGTTYQKEVAGGGTSQQESCLS